MNYVSVLAVLFVKIRAIRGNQAEVPKIKKHVFGKKHAASASLMTQLLITYIVPNFYFQAK